MKSRIISIDLYRRDVMVCFGSKEYLEKRLRGRISPEDCREMLDGINEASLGRSFAVTEQGPYLLWMPEVPGTYGELATLSHEIFHIAIMIMYGIGAGFSNKSEEAYAYLVGYLTEKILRAFKITFSS